ncbi:MAG: hypothetical protein KatS3mg110_3254 [Pirellulaceae bacterium]|nr:MAG: hypothetical protein KatS3mg110_3254 [Pirellulaceae bacterium]
MFWVGCDSRTAILASALVLVFMGCGESPKIQRYQAPKDPVPLQKAVSPAASREPARLMAAVVRRDGAVWFFKMVASPELAEQHEQGLRQIVQSVTFDAEGNPHWTLPEGWSENAGDAIRYRTLVSSGELGRSVEVSVTRLPATGGDWDAYLLANVNRWRGQIGLPALSALELADAIQTFQTASGEEAYWCDFQSGGQEGGSGRWPASVRCRSNRIFTTGRRAGALVEFAGRRPAASRLCRGVRQCTSRSDVDRPGTPERLLVGEREPLARSNRSWTVGRIRNGAGPTAFAVGRCGSGLL